MAIEKLSEFAKDGQKNTDNLVLTDGFSVSRKPARQWFNWLFNTLTLKINEIIDGKIDGSSIVDDLTTNDATKPVSAKQAKFLNDNKLGKTENAVSATKLKDSRSITLIKGVTGTAYFNGSSNIQIEATVANLGVANGIATLDPTGKVPSNQLPSYVDDVLEYATTSDFPATGETGKIYVETTGNTTYRWSGSAYAKITSGEVSSVAGKKGVVTLVKADVGLGNVDNTADSNKSVASAAKLATARTIGGVPFDGTANINLPLLGYSQTYQDVKASRVNNTYYTNTSGKPIAVFMAIHDTNGSGFGFEVGEYAWSLGRDLPAYMYYPMSFIVPNGISYKVFWAGTASELLFWTELR